MKIFYKVIFFLIFFFNENSFCQAPNWAWAKSAIGDSGEVANSIATDSYGNIYVTGTFTSPVLSFGTISLVSSGNEDIFIAKYDANGNVLWAKSAGGTYWDRSTSITVDAFDNIYVTGCFESDTLYFDNDTLVNLYYGMDLFIAKYDSSGNVLWAKRDGIGASQPNAITTDISGNVYLTGGYYSAIIVFGSDTLNNLSLGGNGYDVFTVKYDNSGNVLWARGGRGLYQDIAFSITTDHNDGLYVTGQFTSPALSFGTLMLNNNGGSSGDIFIVKYDTSGNVIWAKNEGGSSSDNTNSIVADNFGNFYLAGYFFSDSITFDSTILFNSGPYHPNMFIAKYDSIGNVIWAKTTTGYPDDDRAESVAVDNAGNIYVTGLYAGSNSPISFDSITLTNSGAPYSDIFIVKYNSNGNALWVKSTIGNTNDEAYSIVYNNSGSIYVGGSFESNAIIFDSYIIPNSNPGCIGTFTCYDMFVAKLDATTGIPEQTFNSIFLNVEPNPFTTTLTIQNTNQKGELIIFDITGKEILHQKTFEAETKINTAHLTPGFYFVNYREENKTVNKKVVKF